MDIGFERDQSLIYEGESRYGRAIWPMPVITPAKIIFEEDQDISAEYSGENIFSTIRFREDQFDPVSRVRRGRFYFPDGVTSQPAKWYVQPHPALSYESKSEDKHGLEKYLDTYTSRSISLKYLSQARKQPLVILGLDDRFTLWVIVNVEVISTGEELVTLKARSSLGVLPELSEEKIPKAHRRQVTESLDAFVDEARRASPTSVIDRARDAASQITIAFYDANGSKAKDLGEFGKRLENDGKIVASCSTKIIARLHARAKPAEKAKHTLRPIREQDAELATQCVGTLLCELGWADWR